MRARCATPVNRAPIRWRALLLLLALAGSAGFARGAGAQTVSAGVNPLAIVPVLNALDRVIHVEMGNASPRDAFGELGRAGGISILLDPAIRGEMTINAVLKGVRLGDALSLVCRYCSLRLLPGNGGLVVAPAPSVAVSGSKGPSRTTPPADLNPWSGWAEMTGLPLTTGGETGYPRLLSTAAASGPKVLHTGPVQCLRCLAPLQPHWVFCPQCGQQRLHQQPQPGKYCWACGRPHEASGEAAAAGRPANRPGR